MGRKILIVVIFVLTGIVVFPPASFLMLYLTYKLIPSGYARALVLGFPFIWGPILGALSGFLIGIKIIISQGRTKK